VDKEMKQMRQIDRNARTFIITEDFSEVKNKFDGLTFLESNWRA